MAGGSALRTHGAAKKSWKMRQPSHCKNDAQWYDSFGSGLILAASLKSSCRPDVGGVMNKVVPVILLALTACSAQTGLTNGSANAASPATIARIHLQSLNLPRGTKVLVSDSLAIMQGTQMFVYPPGTDIEQSPTGVITVWRDDSSKTLVRTFAFGAYIRRNLGGQMMFVRPGQPIPSNAKYSSSFEIQK